MEHELRIVNPTHCNFRRRRAAALTTEQYPQSEVDGGREYFSLHLQEKKSKRGKKLGPSTFKVITGVTLSVVVLLGEFGPRALFACSSLVNRYQNESLVP